MKKITCKQCSCEFELIEEVLTSKTCPICGAELDNAILSSIGSEKDIPAVEMLRVQCIGATTFNNDRELIVYDDHIALVKNNGQVLFDESYDNVSQLKGGTIFAPNFLTLELKNGGKQKIKLNGNDFKMLKLAKTLPDYVNKIISEYNK